MSPGVLEKLGLDLISDAPIGSPFDSIERYNGVTIDQKDTICWVQYFMVPKGIVSHELTGKLFTSHAKKLFIKIESAFNLGFFIRGFNGGIFREEDMENYDETRFVFNMDNGKHWVFEAEMM